MTALPPGRHLGRTRRRPAPGAWYRGAGAAPRPEL